MTKIRQNVYISMNSVNHRIKERSPLKKAEVGNVIEFRNGLKGVVEKVNENSVIVDITINENYRDLELEQRTVVNHKNYRIVREHR